MKTDFDVIIVGGGLAGLSLSCLLGQTEGLKVACIDQGAPADDRTTAISYGSSKILDRAGVWDEIVKQGCPIKDIEILDGDSPLLLQFLSREVDDKPFGWITPNKHIRKCLSDHMSAEHITPAKVQDFEVHEDHASVKLEDGRELTAKLIIGADGRKSAVREFMDVDIRSWSYNQQAVVCFITHENPHQNKAIEHFWPEGPFAILPISDREDGTHCSSLVFTEHKTGKDSLMNLSSEDFAQQVAERFPEFYGETKVLNDKRMAYPLSLVHAAEYIAPRMALVADAAHGIHPIAGQGLNLGFRDLGEISNLIHNAFEKGEDIGSKKLLQTYQRRRRPDNMAMVAVTDGLVRLFSNDLKTVKFARRFGLRAVSRISKAKKFFMQRAMGE